MAEFLRLKTVWLNVDKITSVENRGTDSAPSLMVRFCGDETKDQAVQGPDATLLYKYLQNHEVH